MAQKIHLPGRPKNRTYLQSKVYIYNIYCIYIYNTVCNVSLPDFITCHLGTEPPPFSRTSHISETPRHAVAGDDQHCESEVQTATDQASEHTTRKGWDGMARWCPSEPR